MDEYSVEQMDHTFAALSHRTRRAMLQELAKVPESVNVTDLATSFDCSLNVASKHIKSLERARLVNRKKVGRVHELRLDPRPLREALAFIERYRERWEKQFDQLEAYLDEMAEEEDVS